MGRFTVLLSRFWASTSGTITIYSVITLVLILTITGASVDLMYHEATRAKLQTTLDRAVLAAADLEQLQTPEDVVIDYVAKAGLAQHLLSVNASDGLNERIVSAEAGLTLDTVFMHMAGFDTLDVYAVSTAEERIANVEISLVLDVSGSMSGDRITNLRAAATEFVNTVIQPSESDVTGLTTVSVVPYNATVNLGDDLSRHYTMSDLHNYSNCPIFDDHAFHETDVSSQQLLDRLAHFDLYSTDESTTQIPKPWCPTGQKSAVIAHSLDVNTLSTHIASLSAGGNTAIDLGMKWGVALLDPGAVDVIAALASDGVVDNRVADRPAAYDDTESVKFVVVMTDGANTTEYDLKPQYRQGLSDVWIDDRGNGDPQDDRFSLRVEDNWGESNDIWFWHRYETSSWSYRNRNTPDGGSNARRMSNAELFARFGTKAVAQKMYVQPYYDGFVSYNAYYDIYYAYEAIVSGGRADDRLSDICTAAKDAGIVVFSIAFEAPEGGQAALSDCASSASHYFDVAGVEITETFHSIARQINSLRLVQ